MAPTSAATLGSKYCTISQLWHNKLSKIQSQSYFTTGSLLSISSSWHQAPWNPWPVIFFQLNTCVYSPYVTSSLTRGWVCRLQLLLVFLSAVILRSKSFGTHDDILVSQIQDSPTLRAKPLYLYTPGTGWPSYTPRHWVLFSSPPMTQRATVEIFEPTSMQDLIPQLTFRVGPCFM
jgi:hypothetical protein